MAKVKKYTHPMIREAAKGICGAAYEEFAKRDDFFKRHPSQDAFISNYWGRFIPQAEIALTNMLDRDDTPESAKVKIRDAMVKHRLVYYRNVA